MSDETKEVPATASAVDEAAALEDSTAPGSMAIALLAVIVALMWLVAKLSGNF